MAFTSTDKRKKLVAAHELEKTQLKENFEQMQLCLQDQVDTLSFQNQSLKAKAKLFEEALNKGSEEQVKMAEAPYLLLEHLRSLIQVLELKNSQIREQDRKIMELEEQVEKTVILEKRLSVLQQQNEDLRARIEQKTILTRQLSDDRAIERMDKEMRENKRLKWKKEELLWKLQGGDS